VVARLRQGKTFRNHRNAGKDQFGVNAEQVAPPEIACARKRRESVDHDRFDELSRTLTSLPSRRGLLGGLAAALVATLPLALAGEDAAAKRKKKKKKKRRKGTNQRGPDQTPRSPAVPPLPPSPPPPPVCVPNCAPGDTCGSDGCGGSCGTCTGNDTCVDRGCVCVPRCAASNACGLDGCGGTCGDCPGAICSGTSVTEHVCEAGTCKPVVTSCGSGQVCFENACCQRQAPSTCRQEPEDDGCGGEYRPNCSLDHFRCPASNGQLFCSKFDCP
jgi:hypothetical protein